MLDIGLGADYDMDATPGLAEGGNEFYSVAGAERLAEIVPTFSQGHVVIGVCGAPFKCPPAPSECALLLHDELTARGVREAAGVFAEGAARVVAQTLIAELYDGGSPERHLGRGTCYIEFGAGRIGSVDIDFLSGPEKTGTFNAPSAEQMALKERFGSSRRLRWFGS